MASARTIAIFAAHGVTRGVDICKDADTAIGGDEMWLKVNQYVKVFNFDCGSEDGHWSLVIKQ
jgi:hypothetical protein